MYDTLAAALLADHINRGRNPGRPPVPPLPSEPESPWARVFAWHRRKHDSRT